MDERELKKNELDLKYQRANSMALKSLGLAFTVAVALLGIGFTAGDIGFFGSLSAGVLALFFSAFYLFHIRSEKYLDAIRELE